MKTERLRALGGSQTAFTIVIANEMKQSVLRIK